MFTLILPWLAPAAAFAQVRISRLDASRLTLEAPPPEYPEIARTAQIRSLVRIDVVVSVTGEVVSTNILSGHPLLVVPAVEAAKKRRYRPLVVHGKAAAFVTTVEFGGPGGRPYPARRAPEEATRFESNISPVLEEICQGDRTYYPAAGGQSDLPMERRQRFEISSCGQVLLYESNRRRPTLVYTTSDSWPLQIHHIVNVLVVPLSGTAGGVLVFHFRHGRVQPVSGGDTKSGIGVQVSDDGTYVSVLLPYAHGGTKTEVLRFPIEY